jgi:hypothetical protein
LYRRADVERRAGDAGVFVFLAARNPPAHRSLILFAAWSSFAHAAIMLVMSFQVPAQRVVLLASAAAVAFGGSCSWSSRRPGTIRRASRSP